jgi:tetratricopeptide (TPR) repeat protein
MGIVYRGEHVETGQAVAIKTVRAASRALLATIRREIHALSRVQHPGIVRIEADGIENGLPWYAMPLLRGRTLRQHLLALWTPQPAAEPGPPLADASSTATFADELPSLAQEVPQPPRPIIAPPPGPTLAVLRRLCPPLACLHGAGLVHRDLKPENILLQEDGRPVLVDLGIAALSGGAYGREELVAEGQLMGTLAYMAPEQIRGELVDARADLYALGCILYECVTGRPPFTGGTAQAILSHHLHTPPIPPSYRVTGIPEALDRLILQLLEKQPQDRLGYAEDVAAALDDLGAVEEARREPLPSAYLYRPVLTGRATAMEVLTRAVVRVHLERQGGLVLLRGESGVGKTRLAMEAARLAVQRDLLVLTGQCVALGAGEADGEPGLASAPLHPLRPLLLTVADLARAGGTAEAERLLGPRGKVLAPYEPALGALPGQEAQPAPPALPPDAARARVIASLKETLFALAATAPLVLILDDLQWMDELSLSLLEALAKDSLTGRGVLVLGTYRMEEAPPALEALASAAGVSVLPLDRLDGASVGRMVSGMLALREPPSGVLEALVKQSNGNPFFVAEYLRAAISEGMLTRDRHGRWHFDEGGAALEALPLPHTLAELIDRRLARLDEAGRALAAWGGVLGREFDADLLMAGARGDEAAFLDAVEALRVQHILEETDDGRLRFTHDKLREAAYERLPDAARKELHRRAGEALEARGGDAAERFPVLAHHFARAEVHDKASRYFARAAEGARAAYANGDAITFYRSALAEGQALLRREPEAPPPWDKPLAALYDGLGDVLALVGRQQEARAAYQEALARAVESPVWRAQLHRKVGKSWETHHKHEEALSAYMAAESALGLEPERADDGWWHEWIQLQIDRISVHYFAARQAEMEALVQRVRPVVERRGAPLQRASFFQALVQKNLRAERYRTSRETVEYARASLEARAQVGEPGAVASARFALGAVLLWHDAFDEAEEVLRETLREAERRGDLPVRVRCLTYLTMVHRRRRETPQTRRRAATSLELAEAAQMPDYVGAARAHLSWVALRSGDASEAERQARQALELWKPLPLVYPFQWTALLPLACISLHQGRLAETASCLRAVLESKQQRLPDELALLLARLEEEPAEQETWKEKLPLVLEQAERLGYL